MNYIHQLQQERNEQQLAADRYVEGIMDLVGYLTSSKFHEDTTVQVQDVINRLAEVRSHAEDAR